MIERILEAGTLDGEERVPASDDGERGCAGDRGRDPACSRRERLELEHAHRAVPEDRLRVGDDPGELLDGARPDVQSLEAAWDLSRRHRLGPDVRPCLRRGHDVLGELEERSLRSGSLHHRANLLDPISLDEAVADLAPVGGDQGERHRSPDQERVDPLYECRQHAELVGDLRASQDGHVGTVGVGQEPAEDLDLLLEQPSRHL